MRRLAASAACLALLAAAARLRAAAPTYLFEWVSRTNDTSGRLTLFADRTLVRKLTSGKQTDMKKRKLSQEEYDYYVAYFNDPQSLRAAGSYESGTTGALLSVSEATFVTPEGGKWKLSFDSLSSLTFEAMRVKSALEGLWDSFGKVLPSPSDFAPEKIPPGTVLHRRDGARFRVLHVDDSRGMVELQGVEEPYTLFLKIDDLRFTFSAP